MEYNPAHFSVDTNRLREALRPFLVEAMEAATDELLRLMKINVHHTVHGDGPGKPTWRQELDADLRRLYINVADFYAEGAVGADYEQSSADNIRAMIINYGGGSAVGNPPIEAGPLGRIVWDEDMRGRHASQSEDQYLLPDAFNQVGNQFIERTVQEVQDRLEDICTRVMNQMPRDIFLGCIVAEVRGNAD